MPVSIHPRGGGVTENRTSDFLYPRGVAGGRGAAVNISPELAKSDLFTLTGTITQCTYGTRSAVILTLLDNMIEISSNLIGHSNFAVWNVMALFRVFTKSLKIACSLPISRGSILSECWLASVILYQICNFLCNYSWLLTKNYNRLDTPMTLIFGWAEFTFFLILPCFENFQSLILPCFQNFHSD